MTTKQKWFSAIGILGVIAAFFFFSGGKIGDKSVLTGSSETMTVLNKIADNGDKTNEKLDKTNEKLDNVVTYTQQTVNNTGITANRVQEQGEKITSAINAGAENIVGAVKESCGSGGACTGAPKKTIPAQKPAPVTPAAAQPATIVYYPVQPAQPAKTETPDFDFNFNVEQNNTNNGGTVEQEEDNDSQFQLAKKTTKSRCSRSSYEYGDRKCCGNTTFQVFTYGSDGCLRWSAPKSCPSGQVCSNGACKAPKVQVRLGCYSEREPRVRAFFYVGGERDGLLASYQYNTEEVMAQKKCWPDEICEDRPSGAVCVPIEIPCEYGCYDDYDEDEDEDCHGDDCYGEDRDVPDDPNAI